MRGNLRNRPLLALTALALATRLVYIALSAPSLARFGDAPEYLSAATTLCTSGSYPVGSGLPFFRAPGLPFFIAAATLCNTGAVWLVKCWLAVVGAMTVAIIYALAKRLFRDERSALIAAAITAVYPFFILQTTDIQTEGLFMFLLLASILAITTADGRRTLLLLSGFCAGMAALVRPVGLILLILLPLWILFSARPTAGWRKYAGSFTTLLAGAAIVLAPWTIRNAVRFHELILVNDAGGYNFWRGTSGDIAHINRISDRAEFDAAARHFETIVSPTIARQVEEVASTPAERSNEWYRLARQDFEREPGAFLLRLLQNAWIFWRPWLNPATSSRAATVISGFSVSFLYVAALLGWTTFRKRNKRMALWFVLYACFFWAAHVPFQVVSRFRIPIIDPICILFASLFLKTQVVMQR